MKKIILLIFISYNLFAQVEYSGRKGSQLTPRFFIDLAGYKSADSGKSKVDVFIKIPYSNVQFLKTPQGYESNFNITVSIYDEDNDVLKFEKLWNERITTVNFKQTISRSSFNISYKSFTVNPGKYNFICKVEDQESRKHHTFEQPITIRKFNEGFEVSDLILVSKFIDTDEGKKVIPNIANSVTTKDTALLFYYEMYSAGEDSVKVLYQIKDKQDEKLTFEQEKVFHLHSGKNEIYEDLNNIEFSLGNYQIEIKVLDKNGNLIKGSGKNFVSQIFGFPPSIKDLDLAIEQMMYIASPSEVGEIEDTEDFDERLRKYINYWKALDPSPNTIENEMLDEYYRRVQYANANFKGYFKGWRSDMGMVYITLGPPDQVTRRPYEMDSRPYEIWEYYNINRSFVFIDQTNFGDYRLANPAYGDWFRYRP